MTDYTAVLRAAAEKYRQQVERAKEIRRQADAVQREASNELATAMRAAFTDGGMKKAAIIRDTNYVWSRTWVDRAVATSGGPVVGHDQTGSSNTGQSQ